MRLKHLLTLSVLLAALVPLVSTRSVSAAAGNRLVVAMLTRVKGGDWKNQIFSLGLDGQQRVRLTNTKTDESNPVVSPDGTKIAFVSTRDGRNQIYVMNADGSNPINVTNDPKDFFDSPVWSPDGTKILYHTNMYHAEVNASFGEIWVVDANGSERQKLRGSVEGSAIEASWSPSGREILFREDTAEGSAIWIMTSSMSDAMRLTDPADRDGNPVWSPSGGQIAFVRGSGEPGVWTMSNDGSNPIQWVADVDARDLAWSPDGESLAYIAAPNGKNALYRVGTGIADDGSDVHLLAPEFNIADLDFAWSPDGRTIAATVNGFSPKLGELVLIDVQTETRTVIVDDVYCNGAAAWL